MSAERLDHASMEDFRNMAAVLVRIEALAAEPCENYDAPGQDCITAGPEVFALEACTSCRVRAALRPTPCPVCGGAGIVDTSPPGVEHTAPWLLTDADCAACGGSGEVRLEDDEEFCPRCFAGTESPEHHEKCDTEETP